MRTTKSTKTAAERLADVLTARGVEPIERRRSWIQTFGFWYDQAKSDGMAPTEIAAAVKYNGYADIGGRWFEYYLAVCRRLNERRPS